MDEQIRKLRNELEASVRSGAELQRKHEALMERFVEEKGSHARQDEARLQQVWTSMRCQCVCVWGDACVRQLSRLRCGLDGPFPPSPSPRHY